MNRQSSKRDEWFDLIKRCEKSGMSQQQFCAAHNLTVSSFKDYRKKYRADQSTNSPPQPLEKPLSTAFMPLTLPMANSRDNCYLLTLSSGIKLTVPPQFETAGLKKFLEVISSC